jgi:hypothetical protein
VGLPHKTPDRLPSSLAAGAVLPKSVRQVPDAVDYLRQVLTAKKDSPLNSLESLFAGLETPKGR